MAIVGQRASRQDLLVGRHKLRKRFYRLRLTTGELSIHVLGPCSRPQQTGLQRDRLGQIISTSSSKTPFTIRFPVKSSFHVTNTTEACKQLGSFRELLHCDLPFREVLGWWVGTQYDLRMTRPAETCSDRSSTNNSEGPRTMFPLLLKLARVFRYAIRKVMAE